jgi:hypothetical protein
LKPGAFKLWVNWIQLVQPRLGVIGGVLALVVGGALSLCVAVQVAFEKANFETRK